MEFMNFLATQDNWRNVWSERHFAQLADDERQFMEGKEDELPGRIQQRTGKAKTGKKGTETAVGDCCANQSSECRRVDSISPAHSTYKSGVFASILRLGVRFVSLFPASLPEP